MFLTRIAIKRPVTTAMFFLALSMLGAISWTKLPVQLLPDLSFPSISVQASMPGASPEKVEQELLLQIEAEIAKMKDIESIISTARNDGGSVRVEFKIGTNMKFVALKLDQKINQLSATLPVGSRAFVGRNFDTEMISNFLMEISLQGDDDLNILRKIAEDKIKPELEKIDGVSFVEVSGGELREAQVIVNEEHARQYEINIVDINTKINDFNREKQFLGRINTRNTVSNVTLSSQVTTLSELEELIIDASIPLRLKDIAEIHFNKEEPTRIFRINGKQSVGLFLLKDDVSNLIETAGRLEAEIAQLNESLEAEGLLIDINFNAAEIMRDTIFQVEKLAGTGAILALLVLLFFLRNIKTVTVILVSIPISLLVTFNLMFYAGLSVNIISLVGLAIAVGMLVDNSIVVLENIFRYYEKGEGAAEASLKGCSEVVRSISASTGTTIAVFIPVLFLQDKYLVILRELSLAVIFPLSVSLLVAFSLIPVAASQFLAKRGEDAAGELRRLEMLKRWNSSRFMDIFSVILKSRLRKPVRTAITLGVIFILTLPITLLNMNSDMNIEDQNQVELYVKTPMEAGLAGTDRIARQIEQIADSLKVKPEVRSVIRKENGTVTLSYDNDLVKELGADFELEAIRENLEKQTELIPGGDISFEPDAASGGGSGGGGGGGGGGNPLAALFGSSTERVIVKGFDQSAMRYLLEDIEERLEAMPELQRVRATKERGALEMQLWANREGLDQFGITFQQLMTLLWASRNEGQQMTTKMKLVDGDVLIRLKPQEEHKRTVDDLKNMLIPIPGLGNVPIKQLTNVIIDEGPRTIRRVDQQRQSEITYEVKDDYKGQAQVLEGVRQKVDIAIQDIQLPNGFTVEIIHVEESENILWWVIGIAALLIFMILSSTFESLKFPWIIFLTIPMAMIGAFWALIITGTGLAPIAMISLLVLLGIVVNNGIILIDYISILRRRYSRNRAVLYAARARVRPILMTSMTTILGILPFAFKTGMANEIWPPFAICLIGGLTFASFLTLIYIPVIYMSIDDVITGLSKKGLSGALIYILVNAGFITFMMLWIDSLMWEIIMITMGISFILMFFYNFYGFLDKKSQSIDLGADLEISIRNLTKIYNEPSKLKNDIRRRSRKEANRVMRGETLVNIEDLYESLIWKAPLFGFFVFLHTFFVSKFWLLMLTLGTYALLLNIIKTVKKALVLRKGTNGEEAKPARFPRLLKLFSFIVQAGMFVYLYFRWGVSPGWPIFWGLLYMVLMHARIVSRRVLQGEIVIHEITGRFEKTRRRFYRLMSNIPIIGRKKPEIRALHGVNLNIKNGMYGLLGPNGAGKTTLMRLLSNIYYQSRGVVYFNEYRLNDFRDFIQRYIGYLPQKFGLYGNFTAWNYLNYLAILNSFGKREDRHNLVESVLKNVNLWDRKDDQLKTYSGGMKQRVGIAQTLLNLPKIIIVDEPTSGLDPRERIRFRNMLAQMSKTRIVIFSTHIVEDISTSCREMAVLNKGEVVYHGQPEEMRLKAVGKVWESMIPLDLFADWNKKLRIVTHIKTENGIKIKYIADKPPEDLQYDSVEPTLEDAYLFVLNPG